MSVSSILSGKSKGILGSSSGLLGRSLSAGAKLKPYESYAETDQFARHPVGAWKALDYLNRLQYPVTNTLRRMTDSTPDTMGSYASGIWKGLSGQERSSTTDVMQNLGWKPTTKAGMFAQGVAGLAGDIASDPLSWVNPGAWLTKAGKLAKLGKLIKIGDATYDIAKDIDKIGDVVRASKAAKTVINTATGLEEAVDYGKKADAVVRLLSKKGIAPPTRTAALLKGLGEIGIQAEPVKLAATLAEQAKMGQRGLLTAFGKKVPVPGEQIVFGALDKAGSAIKAADAAGAAAKSQGIEKTIPQMLAGGLMDAKRKLGFAADEMKKVMAGSRGAGKGTQRFYTEKIEKLVGKLDDLNITTPEHIEVVQLLGSPLARQAVDATLGKNWWEVSDRTLDWGKAIDAVEKTMNPTTGKPLYSLDRINRLRNNIKTFDDIDKVRKGVLVVEQIEPMNIAVGRIPEGIAENRAAKEGIAYVTMKKNKESLLAKGKSATKGGVDSTRAKTSTPFMTVWEAVNGQIDPAVELHLKALGDAEQSFKRIKDRPNSVVNWYKTEFLPRHAAAIDQYKVDEITAKITDYQAAVKNKSGGATKIREEIADALSAAKMISATTGLSAGGALRNMKKKFPAITDLSQIATHNLTEVRKHVERTEFLKGLLKFAKKDDAGGTLYKVEDLVNSAYLDKLGRGGKHMGSLVDGIKGSFLDYDTFKTAQQYLSFVNDDASLTNLLKKVSDFTKAFMVAGPGFVTRNMVSNMVMGHAAGDSVFDPATWARMSEVGRFLTWDGRLKNPDQIVEILGKNYTSKQVMDMAEFAGAIGTTRAEQFVEKAAGKEGTAKKIALAYPRLIRDASNGREQISKVSHFLSRLRQGWSPDDASLSVAKYFYDYGSLTPTERKIQAFVPFYSWLRLNTERQIRNLIEQPTYLSQPQKLANAMSSASEDTAGTPQDWTPEWIQRGGQMLMPSGSYGTLQAWMPQMDILRALPSTWAQTAGESLTPAIRIPLELSANKSWFTGKPIADVGRETAPFLGVPMRKEIPYALGWMRPLQELNKSVLPAIPAYSQYATGRGAYTTGTPTENLASWATGIRTYPFEPKRLAMDRYRQISDDLMKLKSAAKSYQGSPGTLERLGNAAEAAQAELDDLRDQMKAQGDWSMGNKKKSTGLLGGSK